MISLILICWVEIIGFLFFNLVNMKCTIVDKVAIQKCGVGGGGFHIPLGISSIF